MKIWAKTDGEVREGKYLVVRRDGTIPRWKHFVIGGEDYAGPAGLRAYAEEARRLGYESEYCDSILGLAFDFEINAVDAAQMSAQLGAKGADPDAGPHRKDCPAVIGMLRGNGDVADLVASVSTLEARVAELEGLLQEIGEYTGDGPPTTRWRDIVREISTRARALVNKA